jgi:DNA-binding CsgD family transcriptional regulator/tetratricopeptide (TPR) repeat protein
MIAVVVGSQGDVPLVGRARELTMLRAAVRSAADGDPRAVLVAGEAGGGKTRLVRALLEDTQRPSGLVLRAQCVDLGDPGLPYLAMVDLVRAAQAVAGADPEVASVLDRLPVVVGLTEPNVSHDGPVDESRRLQLFDAMATLLAGLGRLRGPVVVTVEDLQWVDASSADFLRFLLSRMLSERLMVVATVRTDGLSARPRVRRLLSELARLPSVDRLDLEPFDAGEVAEYLARLDGGRADPEVATEVFRRTRGNPYYVQTLASALGSTGSVDDAIPRALADLLVGRLDGLPDDTRTVVRCAAVAARPVPDRLLRQVVGLPDAVMDEAVRVAVAEGLLRPDGAGYCFAHDLLRGAVYDDLLPGERARLHAAHAGALEAGTTGSAPPAEVAHHFTEAQDVPKALVWSVRAAEEAMRVLAPGEALQHLERALAEWPSVDDAPSLTGVSNGRLAVRAARAAGLAGEPSRAIEWAGRAIRLCDADEDGVGGVQARAELVRQLVEVDAAERSVRPAEEAVRLADSAGVDPRSAALAHVLLARALLAARRTDEARPQAERALAQARAVGASDLEVDALTTAAFLDEIAGDRGAAADRLGAALRLAQEEGELAAELRARFSLASLHYYNGDVSGSLPVLQAAMTRVTESGLRWSDPGVELRLLHAVALYVSGDLDASLKAAQAPESHPPDVAAARLAAVSCYAAVARGLPDAERRLSGLRGSWNADPQVALVAGGCEADRLVWEGDWTAAVAIAERAQTHLDDVAGEGMYGGLWLSALALAALADEASSCRQRRDEAGAAAAIRQGEVLMQRVGLIVDGGYGRPGAMGPEGEAWHARAVAEHARLLGEPAVELWQQALEAYGYGHVYEQARCRWRLAEAMIAAGDRAGARTHAQVAADAAEQMRAVPLQRAVAATMTRAGLVGAAATGDAVLTGREREVLALVAEGLTNREVGKRLFISEKTASVHLSNLMAKLNVSSRTEAVTVAHRRGLLDVIGPDRPSR